MFVNVLIPLFGFDISFFHLLLSSVKVQNFQNPEIFKLAVYTEAKTKRGLFLGPFFLKTDAAGWLFILIFIQQKTDVGTFLSRKYRKWSRE